MKIIVADDCTLTKEGIKSLLKPEADMNVVAEAEDGEKAIRLVKELKPDALLLNVKLPRANGLEVIRRARGLCKVIVIAAGDDGEKFIQAGAWDCLPRNMAGGDLAAALYKAKDEKAPPRPEAAGKKPLLTAREIEVIQLIGQGMSNKAIANELYLSEKTVKNHLTNIFKKLKVADRTQALLYALKNRLVSL